MPRAPPAPDTFERQKLVRIDYKGEYVGEGRLDLLVGDRLVVELKAVRSFTPIDKAKLISYLKAAGRHLALLITSTSPPSRTASSASCFLDLAVSASWRFKIFVDPSGRSRRRRHAVVRSTTAVPSAIGAPIVPARCLRRRGATLMHRRLGQARVGPGVRRGATIRAWPTSS